MDNATRAKLTKAILTIVGILLAALMGWLAGCSARWTPAGGELNFLWPHRDVELKLRIDGATTRPADPAP